jgi:hypothetical protein
MASNQAHDRDNGPARPSVDDVLGRLEERLDRASQAAERLLADAAQRVTATRTEAGSAPEPDSAPKSGKNSGSGGAPGATPGPSKPPPAGWQQPAPDHDPSRPLLTDADLLLGLVGALRDRLPPELQQRLAEAIREVLLALRALIDWYLERTDRGEPGPAEVQDIPIL